MPLKQKISRFCDKAAKIFANDYNCAQSVLLAMQEYYGIPDNELIPKIATPFGGGIGRRGSLCGALTGAVIAIGLKYGTNMAILAQKEKSYKLAQELYDRFVEECGSSLCKELIGYDLSKPEELDVIRKLNIRDKKCSGFVKKAVEILISLEAR